VEPGFAEGLAAFARAVAERYPWVEDYTPVNEPLTTARFSGLYGYWYPHGRDVATFARALVVECRAVALAMVAIRAVNPAARLIQTDDLGKTHSTPLLAYQAAYENERRWLSWDLLCGRVDRHHALWPGLRQAGVGEAELAWFQEQSCPPDVIGINHYLSSERFLDERVERYPVAAHGGNGRHAYADMLAARVCAAGPAGPRVLLQEAWDRYRRPIAVTEAHNGCTREEQLRWLDEVWRAARAARRGGADVRAVTVWSLLGAYDWDSLVTTDRGTTSRGCSTCGRPSPGPRPSPGWRGQSAPVLATSTRCWRRPAGGDDRSGSGIRRWPRCAIALDGSAGPDGGSAHSRLPARPGRWAGPSPASARSEGWSTAC
jgi:dTDP-4-dehydrorhamnose reductase